jgi:hypothetical protein
MFIELMLADTAGPGKGKTVIVNSDRISAIRFEHDDNDLGDHILIIYNEHFYYCVHMSEYNKLMSFLFLE